MAFLSLFVERGWGLGVLVWPVCVAWLGGADVGILLLLPRYQSALQCTAAAPCFSNGRRPYTIPPLRTIVW
ncbi:hypothetical protein LZ31DRAFT_561652 [Colletotrichum somersetense]|nr:hypothetical protein LZ31DRAFT_561652 [Colletotrichum somersetense]